MIAAPRLLAPVMVLILSLLAGCMLVPGRFVSELDLRRDGTFAYTYRGEIHLLALSKLMNQNRGARAEFSPSPCRSDESGEHRECSRAEIDAQRREWQEERDRTEASRRKENEQMKAMLGGLDPDDPRAAEELAQRLRRQVGWKQVDYKGDGLFEVDFALSGTLGHDFRFPTIERFPLDNAFVQMALRSDGSVRVDAPGFGPGTGGEPWRNMMQMAALAGNEKDAPRVPVIDGTFTIRTDGAVLSNNTDEGPQQGTAGQQLAWTINARTGTVPMAVIRLR